jgi:hypothetical protein
MLGCAVILLIFLLIPRALLSLLEALRINGERGYYVPATRYPTGPNETARLPITFSARHTPEQIKRLCSALRKYLAGVKAAERWYNHSWRYRESSPRAYAMCPSPDCAKTVTDATKL